MKKTSDIGNKSQAERLKDILKSFGINSQEELDGALAGALGSYDNRNHDKHNNRSG